MLCLITLVTGSENIAELSTTFLEFHLKFRVTQGQI